MLSKPITRSQAKRRRVIESEDEIITRKTGKSQRNEESEVSDVSDGDMDEILEGLTLTKDGNIVVDENLLNRLRDRNNEEEQEQRVKVDPFKDAPMFKETLKNGTKITMEFLHKCSKDDKHKKNGQFNTGEMIGTLPLDWLALKTSAMLEDNWDYNTKVEGNPRVNDQGSSGLCWLYALTNCFRLELISKLHIEDKFEFSNAYIFFYDKIERCNLFLEYMWTFRNKNLDDREVRMFTAPGNHIISDGGCYNYAVSLISKYGIVPKNVYCGSFNAKVSEYMNSVLMTVLNHMALEIFRNKSWTRKTFDAQKQKYMKTIYDLVVKFLGEPPKPTDTFNWTYKDQHGELQTMKNLTAEKFYRVVIPHGDSKIAIINDPRHPETYFCPSYSEYSVNMIGGEPSLYINLPLDQFKKTIYESLKNGSPVWMACDMGKCLDIDNNTSDASRFNYTDLLGVNMEYSKADELDVLTSTANHAMLFNGVDVSENGDGEVVGYKKWRIMNSWGYVDGDDDTSPDHGYHRMTDSYFDKYVYMAVVDANYFDPQILEKFAENLKAGKTFTYKSTDAFSSQSLRAPCQCCQRNRSRKEKVKFL